MANDEISGLKIFNPAAVVTKTSEFTGGNGGKIAKSETPKSQDGSRENVEKQDNNGNKASGSAKAEVQHHISQVSRARAANGDPHLSYETQLAIKEGAIPPVVVKPRQEATPQDVERAIKQTASLQQEPQPQIESDAVIVELSNVAVALASGQLPGSTSGNGSNTSSSAPGASVDIVI